jgi:hypothetical protein
MSQLKQIAEDIFYDYEKQKYPNNDSPYSMMTFNCLLRGL